VTDDHPTLDYRHPPGNIERLEARLRTIRRHARMKEIAAAFVFLFVFFGVPLLAYLWMRAMPGFGD
jgi:hypothetical protein